MRNFYIVLIYNRIMQCYIDASKAPVNFPFLIPHPGDAGTDIPRFLRFATDENAPSSKCIDPSNWKLTDPCGFLSTGVFLCMCWREFLFSFA